MPERQVPCPVCRQPVDWNAPDAYWRPFCSERCQTLDLGGWLNEDNRIPGVEAPEGTDLEADTDQEATEDDWDD